MSYAAKPAPYGAQPNEANNQLGTVALVLGVLGLVMGCPISLAAMITGWMGMKKEPSGMARAGFWLGTAATILQIAVLGIVLVFFGAALGIGLSTVEVQRAPDVPMAEVHGEAAPAEVDSTEVIEVAPEQFDTIEVPDVDVAPAPFDTLEVPDAEVAPSAP